MSRNTNSGAGGELLREPPRGSRDCGSRDCEGGRGERGSLGLGPGMALMRQDPGPHVVEVAGGLAAGPSGPENRARSTTHQVQARELREGGRLDRGLQVQDPAIAAPLEFSQFNAVGRLIAYGPHEHGLEVPGRMVPVRGGHGTFNQAVAQVQHEDRPTVDVPGDEPPAQGRPRRRVLNADRQRIDGQVKILLCHGSCTLGAPEQPLSRVVGRIGVELEVPGPG